jgi:hypothetical protein
MRTPSSRRRAWRAGVASTGHAGYIFYKRAHPRAVPGPPWPWRVVDRGWYRARLGRWQTAPGPPYGT